MPEDIDYKGLYEQLQKENEQLRARVLYMKSRSPWLEIFTWENIRALFISPYFHIGFFIGMVLTMFLAWFNVLKEGTKHASI